MAEERVVRLRLERVGFDEADKGAATLEQRLNKLAGAEQKLNREAKPAASSVSKLAQEEGKAGTAAAGATPKVGKLGDGIQQTGKQAAAAGGKFSKAGNDAKTMGDHVNSLANKLKGAVAGFLSFQAIKGILTDAIEAIKEDEAATALLEARIRSTGGAAERSLEQLDALAGGLSRGTGIDDEAIKNAEIELQSFDRVYGDVFDRAVRLATDLGAVSGDVAGEITLLGKALQDPEEGIAGLEKNIGRLTDAQADLIVKTAKAGEYEKAQMMLLDVVERRVGGTAAAYRDTLGGALRAASTEWENQLELLRDGLSPAIRQIAEDFVRWSQSAEGQERIVDLGKKLGEIVDKVGTGLRDLDATKLTEVINAVLDLSSGLVSVVSLLDKIGDWTPGALIFDGLISGVSKLRQEASQAWDALQRLPQQLDPRAMAGAGIGSEPAGGMSEAERKAWDQAEAEADRVHEREKERREDLAKTAAEEAKKLQSARDAAVKMVEGIKQEARARAEATEVMQREGVSREELAKQIRELEIREKAEAKVAEVRAAYQKAHLRFTESDAAALRKWVVDTEHAIDAAKKWASIDIPKSLKPITVKVKLDIVDGGEVKRVFAALEDVSAIEMASVIEHLGNLETIRQENQASLDEHNQAIYDDLTEQALALKDSLATPKEELAAFNRYLDALGEVTDSTGQKILSATEIERARGQAVEAYYSQQIDAWTGFLQQLGDQLGGFFSEVARAAAAIQGVNSTAQSLGGWQSMAGAFGGTIAAFAALYSYADSIIKKHDSQKYGTRASVGRTGGFDVMSYYGGSREIENASLELARSIRDAIESIEDSLRVSIDDLKSVEVRASNDGKKFQVWIAGVYYNTFADLNEALRAAAIKALQDSGGAGTGMSDLMLQGLGSYTSPDTEGLIEFLEALRQISDLQLSQGAIGLQQTIHQLDELWAELEKLPSLTPQVAQGFQDLSSSIVQAWQDWADSISGRQKSNKELLAEKQKEAELFEKQKALFIAQQKLRVLELREKLENLKARANVTQREGDIDAGGLGIRIKLMQAEAQLTGAESDMTSQRIALIQEQIDAINGIIAEIEKIEPPKPGLGPRGGGGRGGADLKDLRQQLRDEIARIQAELQGPVHAAFFDFQQSIEDFKKRAKEAKLPADEIAAGIAAMTEQFKRSLLEQARALAGIDTDFTSRLRDVKKFFDELRELGRQKTGMPKWLVDLLEGKALARLGTELQQAIAEFGGMANPMLAIQMQAAELRTNLLAFAQAAGWSAEQIAAAQADIDAGVEYQRQQGINSLLDRLFGWMKQAGIQTEADLEHERTKALLDLQIIEAQLRFFGALTDQAQAWIDGVRDWVNGDDFKRNFDKAAEVLYNPPSTWSWNDVAEKVKDALEAWREGVRDFTKATQDLMTNDQLSGLTQEQQLAAAEARMNDLAARARGGDVEALKELAAAREEYLAEARESFQGGSGYESAWQKAMIQTADLLAHAQETEEAVMAKAMADAIAGNANNAQEITAAVYDGAAQVVAAIYRLMQGLPAYGDGGYVDRPHLAIVGDRPEYILPAVPGLRGPGTVSVVHGTPASGRSDALLDKVLREQRRHTPALRATAFSSGSTARSSREMLDAETRARVVNGRRR